MNSSLEDLRYSSLLRPYLEDGPDFNISHSGEYIICGISPHASIGVDIEEIKPIEINDFTNEFSSTELKLMSASENPFAAFYRLWTQKEAFLKALGKGLFVELNKVEIHADQVEWEGKTWHLQEIHIADGYSATVCADIPGCGIEVQELKFENLYDQIPLDFSINH